MHALLESANSQVGFGSFRSIPWFAWGPMEAAVRVPDQIVKTVVFLGRADNAPFVPYGTGFITAEMISDDEAWQTIVTARHVIERINSEIIYMRLNNHSGEARVVPLKRDLWHFHPDERVDVAIYPSILPRDQFDIIHFPIGPHETKEIFDHSLSADVIKKYDVGIGDEIYVSGLFIGRVGERQNIPITRIGTIAAMPGEPIRTQYGFHEAFLIEMHSMDGLSGSPVCLHLSLGRLTNGTGIWVGRTLPPPTPLYFLMGMVLGYNEIQNPSDAVVILGSDGKKTRPNPERALVPMNTGIAVILPIWKIKEAMNQPSVAQKRLDILKKLEGSRRFVPTSAADPLGVAHPVDDENHNHLEDFNRLVDVAARKRPQGDQP